VLKIKTLYRVWSYSFDLSKKRYGAVENNMNNEIEK